MMMADSWQISVWEGCWSVLACLLVAVESLSSYADRAAPRGGEALGWGWLGSYLFFLPPASNPLQRCASLPLTYNWLFSLMNISCLSLRPPAAVTAGWFLPVKAVSLAGLCNAFLEHQDHAFFLGAFWRRLLWACTCVYHNCDVTVHCTASEARQTLCWAGWLSWGCLCWICSLAFWCQGWSTSSIAEIAQVAQSTSNPEPRSLHHTGGWEWQWLCTPVSSLPLALPHSLWQSSKETTGFGEVVVKILDDCGITRDDTIQANKLLHCFEVGNINADLRTADFSWRELLQHPAFIQADG